MHWQVEIFWRFFQAVQFYWIRENIWGVSLQTLQPPWVYDTTTSAHGKTRPNSRPSLSFASVQPQPQGVLVQNNKLEAICTVGLKWKCSSPFGPTHRVPNLLGWHSRLNSTIFLYKFYESYHKQITLRKNNDRTTGQLIKCHHVLEGLFTFLINAPKIGKRNLPLRIWPSGICSTLAPASSNTLTAPMCWLSAAAQTGLRP